MRSSIKRALAAIAASFAVQAPVLAEDIDLFAGGDTGVSGGNPNILFIIDNTANWSASNQHWPDEFQGEAELQALKQVVGTLDADVNAGLMMFDRDSSGGGVVRFAIRPMTADNKTSFQNLLQQIYDNFQQPQEKVPAGKHYSGVLFDAFKYFGGFTSPPKAHTNIAGSPTGHTRFGTPVYTTPGSTPYDAAAYTVDLKNFIPPETITDDCARNYIVFIGNGFADAGSQEKTAKIHEHLAAIEGDVRQIPVPVLKDNKQVYADEWARYLYKADANAAAGQQNIATYTIDVFNKKPSAEQAAVLTSMARVGGGKYFAAKNKDMIISALKEILIEIQATDSVFASAALPVSANSRAENDNTVFLGLFRPDPKGQPRWFGNLKRYTLASFGGYVDLADKSGSRAVNTQTGFFSECSISYWTSDSGSYWADVPISPSPASTCTLTEFDAIDPFSDLPDGPRVEKGGVAEVLRKGNNPPMTDTAPTWTLDRKLLTAKSGGLVTFNSANTGLSSNLIDYISGMDLHDENADAITGTQTRPSIHGDVIHSRLLPITYPGSTGTMIFYGSNDGTLRAVNAGSGREHWAFVAPEFFPKLQRLQDNKPLIRYPSNPDGIEPPPTRKDYFFDGSIGAYQTVDSSKIWIFPAMRRGGRMIYGLDVSAPDNPSLLWRLGCPNLDNDSGCTPGFSDIGQTWSAPVVAFVKGYEGGTEPLIVVGGGYDGCEDADEADPSCDGAKGRSVFVLDAQYGTLLKNLGAEGMRSIAGDVSLVDINFDGFVDYAYAADTGGNLWRIDFVDAASGFAPLGPSDWRIARVAYTNGSGRKFLFGPAVLPTKNKVYLAIGSGDREHPLMSNYPYTDVSNRFYVYLDDPLDDSLPAGGHDLDSGAKTLDLTEPTVCSTEGVVPGGEHKSWYMDLNAYGQGEQTTTSALIAGGMVVFSTNRPEHAPNKCSASLGEARGYWVNLLNGSGAIGSEGSCGGDRSSVFVGGGLPPSPVRGVVRINGKAQNVIISAVQRDGAVSSSVAAQKLVLPIKSRRERIYWFQEGAD